MKKLFFVFAVTGLLFSFSSCTKDYTCTCTGGTTNPAALSIPKAKKSDAETTCDTYQTAQRAAGHTNTTCGI